MELLVVVAIIAGLVTILMPSLHRARLLAVRAMCASNLKSIGSGSAVYASENGDVPPPAMRAAGFIDFESCARDRAYGPGTTYVNEGGRNLKEDGWSGVGRLIRQDYAPLEMAFCPSLSDNDRGAASHVGLGAKGTWGGPQRLIIAGYNFRYRMTKGPDGKTTPDTISSYPGGWVFMFDRLMGLGRYQTSYAGDDLPPCHWALKTMNWARVDGSVTVHEYGPEIEEWYRVGPSGSYASTLLVKAYLKDKVDEHVSADEY